MSEEVIACLEGGAEPPWPLPEGGACSSEDSLEVLKLGNLSRDPLFYNHLSKDVCSMLFLLGEAGCGPQNLRQIKRCRSFQGSSHSYGAF